MPELPEVETMRRGLLGCVGQQIVRVSKPQSRYRPIVISPEWRSFRQKIEGCEIKQIRRIAKRVLVDLDSASAIVFQPKMAGLLVVGAPPSDAHIRMRFDLSAVSASVDDHFLYWDRRGLGTIHLWDGDQQVAHLGPDKLGPDAMVVSESDFVAIFRAVNREVKVALLDQKLVAGIGNLYASEILHRSQIKPQTRCNKISKARWGAIWRAMVEILSVAIEYEGSTLSDGTYVNSVSEPGRYQNEHLVYARGGECCRSCQIGTITRIVQAQRSTFYCPRCQRR
jgi:formamidopyrimidine-DNA glycosylase